jgi:hypothetical protein
VRLGSHKPFAIRIVLPHTLHTQHTCVLASSHAHSERLSDTSCAPGPAQAQRLAVGLSTCSAPKRDATSIAPDWPSSPAAGRARAASPTGSPGSRRQALGRTRRPRFFAVRRDQLDIRLHAYNAHRFMQNITQCKSFKFLIRSCKNELQNILRNSTNMNSTHFTLSQSSSRPVVLNHGALCYILRIVQGLRGALGERHPRPPQQRRLRRVRWRRLVLPRLRGHKR